MGNSNSKDDEEKARALCNLPVEEWAALMNETLSEETDTEPDDSGGK